MKVKEVLWGGITNNPVFILVLGMCPVLAVSTTLEYAFWLGISTTVVLIANNVIISLLRNIIPDKVRIPCYIIIVATLVTVVEMFLAKFVPAVYSALGSFIKLIVVNCIILARAEAFASGNKPQFAALDGVSMGIGFTLAICILGALREILSKGAILGHQFIKIKADGVVQTDFIAVFGMAAGGFIVFGILMAVFNHVNIAIRESMKLKKTAPATVADAPVSNEKQTDKEAK